MTLKEINKARLTFKWHTMKGETLILKQMKTSHIFNSMKMLYNHLAGHHDMKPVWYTKVWSGHYVGAISNPVGYMKRIIIFLVELQERDDLPEKYKEPMNQILSELSKKFRGEFPKLEGVCTQ